MAETKGSDPAADAIPVQRIWVAAVRPQSDAPTQVCFAPMNGDQLLGMFSLSRRAARLLLVELAVDLGLTPDPDAIDPADWEPTD